MKRALREMVVVLLSVLMLCTVSVSAVGNLSANPGISPQYVVIKGISSTLSIDRSGKTSCGAIAKVDSSSYTIELTCTLCKTDGSVVKSWSASGKRSVTMDKSWYVTSSSSYQVVATATVYDANGNYVDSGTAYSSVVSY